MMRIRQLQCRHDPAHRCRSAAAAEIETGITVLEKVAFEVSSECQVGPILIEGKTGAT